MKNVLWRCALGWACALSPAAAAAQLDPKVYCLSASECYAAAFQFTDYLTDPAPHTIFSVYLQSLQGSYAGSSSLAYRLSRFHFLFFNQANSAGDPYGVVRQMGAGAASLGSVGPVERTTGRPTFEHIVNGHGGHVREDFLLNGGVGFGVLGCTIPPYLIPGEWAVRTCPRLGLTGWARLDFRIRGLDYTSGHGSPVPVSTRFTDFTFSFSGSRECTFGSLAPRPPASPRDGNCQEYSYDAFVTPEPASLGLVAVGLAALAGVRRRRSRGATSTPARRVTP